MTNELIIDGLGHLFYISIALGLLFLNKKNKIGWIFRFIGELGWGIIGLYLHLTSIWVWCIIFCCIDIRGYYKWQKNQE